MTLDEIDTALLLATEAFRQAMDRGDLADAIECQRILDELLEVRFVTPQSA